MIPKVLIILGSDSDLKIATESSVILDEFSIPNKITIASAHRSPDRVLKIVKDYESKGTKVFIAVAGAAAHLPGVISAYTTLPVIGVPIKSSALEGVDALLSIVQMPSGIPVATVGINNAKNAALLAVSILSINDKKLSAKLKNYRSKLKTQVETKAKKLEDLGYSKYLEYFSKQK